MTSPTAGALLGFLAAIGATMVIGRALALRPPSLLERIAPFVPSTPQMLARVKRSPGVGSVLIALLGPRLGTRSARTSHDLRVLQGGQQGVDRFRLDQVVAVSFGAGAGTALGSLCAARGAAATCVPVLLASGAIAGAIWADRRLSQRIRRRRQQMASELPAVAELLAFAAAAGESPTASIERVCRTLGGALVAELRNCIGAVRGGQALDLALRDMAERLGSPEVERFIDALVIAIERGAPLADVLRAQASDVRAADRRALMEKAGRKEVAMLVPVVFLILPTVVLIAVFPGVQGLQLVVR